MRIVIYTRDFEPITVIDLPMWAVEQLHEQRTLLVAVLMPIRYFEGHYPDMGENLTVCLTVERIKWIDRSPRNVIVAEDDTMALKLKPSWLPGQQAAINAYEDMNRALANALMKALRHG